MSGKRCLLLARAPDRARGRAAGEAAKDNRWGHRDSTMVLLAFRHGLRASELVDLRWEQVDLEHAILHVRRVKQGTPATHPLTGRELGALRRLQREQESKSPFVFVSERGTAFSNRGFQAMVERAAKAAVDPTYRSIHRTGADAL
jgi:integrase